MTKQKTNLLKIAVTTIFILGFSLIGSSFYLKWQQREIARLNIELIETGESLKKCLEGD